MKKVIKLLPIATFAGIFMNIEISSSNILDTFKHSQLGQAVGSLGKAAVQAGQSYGQFKLNEFTSQLDPVKSNALNQTTVLQNDLNTQIQLIDQQTQNSAVDQATRQAYAATRQSYVNALTPLGQLAQLLAAPTTAQNTATILSQAPILAQNTATALANTAYGTTANNLLVAVNNMDSALAAQVNNTASDINTAGQPYLAPAQQQPIVPETRR